MEKQCHQDVYVPGKKEKKSIDDWSYGYRIDFICIIVDITVYTFSNSRTYLHCMNSLLSVVQIVQCKLKLFT